MKRLYPHTRLLRKEYLPNGSIRLVHAGRHKKNTYILETVVGRSLEEDPVSVFGGGYYGSVKKKGGKRELPNSAVRRGLESSVSARMRGESPKWMVQAKDRGKESRLAKRANLEGVGMAHWGVPHIIARKVKRQQAHNILIREGFEPVPGSSRYQSHTGAVGRIVDAGGAGDSWNVELTHRTK